RHALQGTLGFYEAASRCGGFVCGTRVPCCTQSALCCALALQRLALIRLRLEIADTRVALVDERSPPKVHRKLLQLVDRGQAERVSRLSLDLGDRASRRFEPQPFAGENARHHPSRQRDRRLMFGRGHEFERLHAWGSE